jgi:nitroreductase
MTIQTPVQDIIISIINDAVHAPSGENSQPWKFTLEGETLHVFNMVKTSHTVYNSKEKSSYFAHGALLEIVSISASHYGYAPEMNIFPDENNLNHIATITFRKEEVLEDILYPYIRTRCSNRNYYTGKVIGKEIQDELLASNNNKNWGACTLVTNPDTVKQVVKTIVVNEQIPFENKSIHNFFYKHLIWKEEEQKTKRGFYVKSLESSIFKILGMRMLSNWYILRFLNIFGTSKIIAFIFGMKYATSGAFGLVSVKGNTPLDYIHGGMMTERIWLTATKLGLAMQPCTGILYMMKAIEDNENSPFSDKHTILIKKTNEKIAEIFEEKDTMVMTFRVGYAAPQKHVSLRIKPDITFL